ncbi:peptide/nickel transport system permease protein [Sporobacter termitidis DSM 10068]|uniref:Peptide/nickel transport system permease protein n=1 Tax=Sporobacter termitidis DSM 10068 TaxID=1123282 RepID=A0A1M5XWR1_9FIRM|nr:ABC transporter permease [Sporobacter termitidis]SHI04162.1 peptide/nickel transport system permease protein [Sporobacter termitidis DSM 10068]
MDKKLVFRRLRRNPFFLTGFICAVVIVLAVVFVPMLLHWDPIRQSLADRFMAPQGFSEGFKGHILGTDQLGRDVLMRLLIGGRSSLIIALIAVVLQNVIGVVLGIVTGYFGGAVDSVVMRICDVFLAIPAMLVAIAVIAVIGASIFNLILVMTLTMWVYLCKVIRNDVRIYKNKEFVSASRVFGGSDFHIMFKQIFPNITTNLLIIGSQSFGTVLLMEAALGFLNLGIQPPAPSWGNMINVGRGYLTTYPWLAIAPGIALMLTILAFNFLGDGLRDVFDPKRQSFFSKKKNRRKPWKIRQPL